MSNDSIIRKVVSATTRQNLTGDVKWVCTLECGHVEQDMKQKRGRRRVNPQPIRMSCLSCNAERVIRHAEANK